jgi:hypothetical protein
MTSTSMSLHINSNFLPKPLLSSPQKAPIKELSDRSIIKNYSAKVC